jgi:hypothetical protein
VKKPHFAIFSRLKYTIENPFSYFPNSLSRTLVNKGKKKEGPAGSNNRPDMKNPAALGGSHEG